VKSHIYGGSACNGIAYCGAGSIPALLNFHYGQQSLHCLMLTTGWADCKLHTYAHLQPLRWLTYKKLSMLIFTMEETDITNLEENNLQLEMAEAMYYYCPVSQEVSVLSLYALALQGCALYCDFIKRINYHTTPSIFSEPFYFILNLSCT
jgi:hypothetical protein